MCPFCMTDKVLEQGATSVMVIENINPSIDSPTEVVPYVRHVQDTVRRLGDVSFVLRLLRGV